MESSQEDPYLMLDDEGIGEVMMILIDFRDFVYEKEIDSAGNGLLFNKLGVPYASDLLVVTCNLIGG